MKKYTEQSQIDAMKVELDQAINQKPQPNIGKVFGWVVFAVVLVFLLYIMVGVAIDKSQGRVPDLFGLSFYEVQSNSMEPTFGVGSILVCKNIDDSVIIEQGDVVTFHTKSGLTVTHRVVEVLQQNGQILYRTKGDNPINTADVDLLTRDSILAVFLFKLPLT